MAEIDDRISMAVVDLETTGLSARNEVPLEVGIKLTDAHGFVLHEEQWLVWEVTQFYAERITAAKKHPLVGLMHEKSGLWEDLLNVAKLPSAEDHAEYTRKAVDADICSWMTDCGVPVGKIPMMGNSTGSLDRPFVLEHFQDMNAMLSYRNIDISSFREVARRVNPQLFENMQAVLGSSQDAQHRVLDDIDACILEYRTYCENFFFTAEDF